MTTSAYLQQASRIAEMESRLAFQERTIEQLNQSVIHHALEIARLREQLKLLAGKLNYLQPTMLASPAEEPPPPHY